MSETLVILKTDRILAQEDFKHLYNVALKGMEQGLILLPADVKLEAVIYSDEKLLYIKDEAGRHIFPPISPRRPL